MIAGAVAAIAGFGIGSLLTPVFALHYGTKLAVAIVSIPHLIGTALRFVSPAGFRGCGVAGVAVLRSARAASTLRNPETAKPRGRLGIGA